MYKRVLATLFVLSISMAQADEIQDFIDESYTPTFDCPVPEKLSEIEAILLRDDLSIQQRFALHSQKTHALICAGKFLDAQEMLKVLMASDDVDRESHYYASAIYQYGFIYDVQGVDDKCTYYGLAEDLSSESYIDVKTSATLALLTECSHGKSEVDELLIKIFDLLEKVTVSGDQAAMAHAHNRVGLYYSKIGLHSLAQAQYLLAVEKAESIYTDENKLAILVSAFSAAMSSHNIEDAEQILERFIALNQNVNTVQTNFLQYLSEAKFFAIQNNSEKLEATLVNWRAIKDQTQSVVYAGFLRWFEAELCLLNQDKACLQDFIQIEENESEQYINQVRNHADYLHFSTRLHLFMGNTELASRDLEATIELFKRRQLQLQEFNRVLNVSSLQNEIKLLENQLSQHEGEHVSIWLLVGLVLVVIAFGVLYLFSRKQSASKGIDAITGLMTGASLISSLNRLSAPSNGKTNALAIFDIANFTQVNLKIGIDKRDYILKQITKTMINVTRDSDIVGIIGSSQFVLCLTDIEEDSAESFFERVKEALGKTFKNESSNKTISVDSSMSVYYETESFTDVDEILENLMLSLSLNSD
ncbi:diguanylate cyclase domain-containing protein [Glaciecola petra]|uniref:Diguanylate cyclase n=1 Tax=Glaciecola petra TaxID=3075602 RepID=A0ABU2ZPR0_9ALTE|nr:diguanylate cyclase [Aestuariibacter sp. P117]MDT0594614.1 diguanylate cyclase [Aestuariibacter sp. P117]